LVLDQRGNLGIILDIMSYYCQDRKVRIRVTKISCFAKSR
jgi:hypothetical protein